MWLNSFAKVVISLESVCYCRVPEECREEELDKVCNEETALGVSEEEITDFSRVRNIATDERIYELRISCNDLDLDICINKNDLIGEPEVGRRFKGVIWLQGNVHF